MKKFINLFLTAFLLVAVAIVATACSVKVDSVKLDKITASVNTGECVKLTATVTPTNAKDEKITWTTSNKNIATVQNGVVRGVAEGKVTITAIAGAKRASCHVTVIAYNTWDGSVATDEEMTSIFNQTTQTYTITKAKQLAKLAQYVNDVQRENNTMNGVTVKLASNLDLANRPWTPIGNGVEAYPSSTFDGAFDGQNYTIYNLKVTQSGNYATAGLFGTSSTGSIKNLTIDGATINSDHYAGGIVAYSSDSIGVTITNCFVKNATIISAPALVDDAYDNGDKVGGIVGYANGATITNCSVEKCAIAGYRHVGGLLGYLGSGTVQSNTVKDTTVTQDFANGYKDFDEVKTLAGEFVGNGATIGENTKQNVTVNQTNKPE